MIYKYEFIKFFFYFYSIFFILMLSMTKMYLFKKRNTQQVYLCFLFNMLNLFCYNFDIYSEAKLCFSPGLNIYNMYIFIYIKLTKVVKQSQILFIRSAGVFHTGTISNPATPLLPCTLFNRKLSISSACGNVFRILPISKSPDLNNFNRIRVYAT